MKFLITKLRQIASLLRFKPFDTSTTEGRSHERHRRAVLTALASVSARGITVITALISVPLTYNYLGVERYGIWMTISSVIAMMSFADLGIGNGLLNRIAEAHGKNDTQAAQKFVSNAFFMMIKLTLLFSALLWIFFPHINWQGVFNISSLEATVEGKQAVLVFAICFLLNLPAGLVTRIQAGYQRGFVNSLWLAAGNLGGLIGVLIAIKLEADLPWLVLAMSGSPLLALLFNGIILFGVKQRTLIPQWSLVDFKIMGSLFRLGASFFLLQICFALAFTSDHLILAQIMGQHAVAEYSVVARLFGIVPMLMEMVLSPLWPAYGEAIARGDFLWVKRTLRRTVFLGGLFTIGAACFLLLTGNEILHLWVGPSVKTSFLLLSGLAIWTIFTVIGNSVAMFLNGSGALKFQVWCGLGLALVAPVAKIWMVNRYGLPGIAWGTVLAYSLFVVIPMSIYVPRFIQRIESHVMKQDRIGVSAAG